VDTASWRTVDFADPDNVLLRPIAYSASTSQLVGEPAPPQVLQPWSYSPLINTPSPTISRASTPSPAPPEPRPSILLPTPPVTAKIPKKHLRTVSLEKAKESMNAPGAVHLLPEELRAQSMGKSRSQEPLRVTSFDIMAGRTPPGLPEAPTLVDNQGRERSIQTCRASQGPGTLSDYSFPRTETADQRDRDALEGAFGLGITMVPLAAQTRKESRVKAAQALGLEDADEVRGRMTTRGPRDMSYDHYLPRSSIASDTSDSPIDGAHKIAQEYHTLLSQQYRAPSDSPASSRTGSDADIRTEMKMVPQPLFHRKPPAQPARDPRDDERVDSGFGESFRRRSSSRKGSFPLRLSVSSRPLQRRRSTSGTIPISPPSVMPLPSRAGEPSASPRATPRSDLRSRRKSRNRHVSAYYPHVMPRKAKKSKGKGKKKEEKADPAPRLMLAADIIAERSKTPERTAYPSPLNDSPAPSDERASGEVDRPLHQRMWHGAAKYADILTRPTETPNNRRHEESPQGRIASPDSPHLLPSPSSGTKPHPPPMHLGWSDTAKASFDRARTSMQSSSSKRNGPVITHVLTPARPLDESKTALLQDEEEAEEEEESGSKGRRGSVFTGMLESWRESKAAKRREELKRMIRVVTPATGGE